MSKFHGLINMNKNSLVTILEELFPEKFCESYDNPGKNIWFNGEEKITGVYLAVDISKSIIETAKQKQCNLIITHHPFIFTGIKKITGYYSEIISKLIENKIDLYSLHTNADASLVSHELAYGLLNQYSCNYLSPLTARGNRKMILEIKRLESNLSVSSELFSNLSHKEIANMFNKKQYNELFYVKTQNENRTIFGVVYQINKTSMKKLIESINKYCNGNSFHMIDKEETVKEIKKIAIIGGSGGGILKKIIEEMDCDMIITSDIKYNDHLTFKNAYNSNLLLIPHDFAERFWFAKLKKLINYNLSIPIFIENQN